MFICIKKYNFDLLKLSKVYHKLKHWIIRDLHPTFLKNPLMTLLTPNFSLTHSTSSGTRSSPHSSCSASGTSP